MISLTFAVMLSSCSAPEPEPVPAAVPTSTVPATQIPTHEPTATGEIAPEPIPIPPEMQEYLGAVDMILVDIAEAGDELDELFSWLRITRVYLIMRTD